MVEVIIKINLDEKEFDELSKEKNKDKFVEKLVKSYLKIHDDRVLKRLSSAVFDTQNKKKEIVEITEETERILKDINEFVNKKLEEIWKTKETDNFKELLEELQE